ncbi:small multi-drug export protein [Bacillus sp. FJAT-45037]|uniref:small multi-drug export protein n=1 Tax=Bacillus sp. FJAT-45037 TaxID=2011007 RepID=UPI000C230A23|nr:small multi-drug export protein [Bacillus sp. FJAT-45037]
MQILWEYILVFLAAATPWLEAIVVIPIGIIRGLNPVLVSVVGFVGNMLTVLLVVVFYEKFVEWRAHRREKKGIEEQPPTKRQERATRVWNKYGLPGLSIGGPLIIGTHLTILMALALGATKKAATWWMTASLVAWILVFAAGTYYGFSWFRS